MKKNIKKNMEKKCICIFILTLFVITGISTVKTIPVQPTEQPRDIIDQYMELCDECEFFENYAWQEFIPTMQKLTMVEVNIAETGGSYDITLTVEKPLGTVLTSKTVSYSSVPPYTCDWFLFDVPDVTLSTGTNYYIVLSYPLGGEYTWCGSWQDNYPIGDSNIGNDWDYTFRTYAEESTNSPPEIPSKPSGLTTLKIGALGEYLTSATDPDGDQVQYMFDWDHNDYSVWLSLIPSGTIHGCFNAWFNLGDCYVRAKARDEHGLESGWSEPLIVTIVEEYYDEYEAIVGFYGPYAYGSNYQDIPSQLTTRYGIGLKDRNDYLCAALYDDVDDTKFLQLQQDEDVKYVQRNYYGQADFIPNDPGWNFQYGPRNIFADDAWDTLQGSTDVILAVIDSGIDTGHPDLGNYIGGYDWINDDSIPDDECGHGTHCAGIVGATGNNNIGMAGINWQISLMSEKVVDQYGSAPIGKGEWICAQAMTHAVNNGAQILSMSLGYDDDKGYIQSAVNYTINQDRLCVTSSGNDETSIDRYPEKCLDDGPIVVGATNRFNDRCDEGDWGIGDGSSFGPELDIVAPGHLIYSTMPTYNVYYNHPSVGFDMNYDNMSGTSMACPHVAGVAALMLARNSDLSSSEIECILESTAQDQIGDPTEDTVGWDQFYGHGLVDADAAVDAASTGFSVEITSSILGEISPPGSAIFTVDVKSLHNTGEPIQLDIDTDYYDISPYTYSFSPNNQPAPFTSTLTITASHSNSLYPKISRVKGVAETAGCNIVRYSDKYITIHSNPLPSDDIVWIKTSNQDDGSTSPNRKGTLHTSPWISCNNNPPEIGGNRLSVTIGKLGDINVDSGPIMVKPYFNEFAWTIPIKDWSSLETRVVNIPAGQDKHKETWDWEIPSGWGEHICVFAQAWRPGTEEDFDSEFYIQENNNIGQRNFFNVGTSSPYKTTFTFENPTCKQMNVKIYAEVPNTNWAVDLCNPAKIENGKMVTPLVVPSLSEKKVALTIIPEEDEETGDVTISYDIEGYEEIYPDMFAFTFHVNPEQNIPPYLYDEIPLSDSIFVSRPPSQLSVNVEDYNSDIMDINFYWKNHEDEWRLLKTYISEYDGKYSFYPPDESDWLLGNTEYIWSVNVTDGYSWTNETYRFTTRGSRYDVNNDVSVNFQDAGLCWVHRDSVVLYEALYDVNSDSTVNFQDAGLCWVNRD